MVAHRITAPEGSLVHGPAQPQLGNALDLWWVHGVVYVDLSTTPRALGLVAWWEQHGYTVEEGQETPSGYTAAVANLRAQAANHFGFRPAVAVQDAAQPGRLNYVPTAED